MTFGNSEKLQTSIPIQNIDQLQSNNEEQQLENRQFTVNEVKEKNYDQLKPRKNSHKQQSFFIDDLIKMVQISLIIALLVFIGILSYAIVNEVREFWFQTQARSVTDTENLKTTNQPIIKMELTTNEIMKNEEKLQDVKQKSIPKEIEQSEHQQKQKEVIPKQNLINDANVIAVQKEQTKKPSEVAIDDKDNVKTQQKQHTANPQAANPTKQPSLQLTPAPATSNPQQVYDPVLIQLNKLKQKSGNKFKDSIYTYKNTSITQQQYEMAKQLIEITQFYNPKERKFDVQQNSQYKCQLSSSAQSNQQCVHKKQVQIDTIVQRQQAYYAQKYKQSPQQQIPQQLPFCIIIPSYKNNHANNIFKNLNSIFQQSYTNYHVIYIDDHSQDGTPEKVKQYMNIYGINEKKLQLHVNEQNEKALSNIYRAAHEYCNQKEIMIIVDGDDYMIGTQVLKLLNYHYQTKKLLAAYTNYLRINQPYYVKVGTSTPYPKTIVDKRAYRKNFNLFRASHLRSFYVDLFRKIKPQDLQDQNKQFFTAANDFAIMMPILEMASPHIEYIPQLTYLYDSGTGLNNFQSKKGVQAANAKIISRRKVYPQVNINEFYQTKVENNKQ